MKWRLSFVIIYYLWSWKLSRKKFIKSSWPCLQLYLLLYFQDKLYGQVITIERDLAVVWLSAQESHWNGRLRTQLCPPLTSCIWESLSFSLGLSFDICKIRDWTELSTSSYLFEIVCGSTSNSSFSTILWVEGESCKSLYFMIEDEKWNQ
jgi:hypothetical protein